MKTVTLVLVAGLLAAVVTLCVVTWRGDQRAHDDAVRLACLERAHATAAIAMLARGDQVDDEGRLQAMKVLGAQLDDC